MKRRHLTRAMAAAWAARWLPGLGATPQARVSTTTPEAAPGGGAAKVLRYAFAIAETGFDPAQVSDLYSRIVTSHIFDAPLTYDHLARPFKLKPLAAEAMPEVSADFRTFTFRIRPGIFFTDDPVFGGKRRELVAEDFVYSLKRIYDPKLKSPGQSNLEDEGIIGLQELHDEAEKSKKPFDYDRPIEGLRALDRYTLRVRLREGRPRHLYVWASRDILGAVAREVVEAYGDRIMEHPVGTGPFQLTDWRRSSRIVLARNAGYRDDAYDAEPNADDPEGQALLQRFKGRRLPMIDRVEISIIEQAQPRWLSFLNAEEDFIERLPNEFVDQAVPGGKVAPNLARRGVVAYRTPSADVTLMVFNMESPVVGGYTAEKVALRRAMALGNDVGREIRIARHGQAIPAQTPVPPGVVGYDPDFRTDVQDHDVAKAKALLDMFGFVDRDGDGYRENPDGSPLSFEHSSVPTTRERQRNELWKKSMDDIGVRVTFGKVEKLPELRKQAQLGKVQSFSYGWIADYPDGENFLQLFWKGSIGQTNYAMFDLPEYNALYEKAKLLPTAPGATRCTSAW